MNPDSKSAEMSSKNKRKNFSPRFAESQDGVAATSEASEPEVPSSASLASFIASSAAETGQNEAKNRFRDFAFKTMQELLNIYGLSISFNDVFEAFKQQQQQSKIQEDSSEEQRMEPPTPPQTPAIPSLSFEERPTITLTPTFKLMADVTAHSDLEDGIATELHSYSETGSGIYDPLNDSNESENGSDCGDSNNSSKSQLSNVKNRRLLKKALTPLPFLSPFLHLAQLQGEAGEKQLSDYAKYLTKYSTYLECNNEQCQTDNMREHFHCFNIQCSNKVLNKKEEIIRHLKWHKKRSESLNHGFLRFSSNDDCSLNFNNCQHNRKQTHYHCLYCDKCYISTSDVQMHSNYHRKDSAIYREGFQRFRATEDCNADYCTFNKQKTTHFHCRRCKFTFKNKADMEKHKTYHIKDEQLLKDGFKKFLKTDACHFENCRFSLVCNHIHCVRENCNYVLHSSGQLLSHKRKHERHDSEEAYRRFKVTQRESLPPEMPSVPPSKFQDSLEEGIPKSVIKTTSFLEQAETVEEAELMIKTYFSDYCNRQSLPSTSGANDPGGKQIECFMGTNEPHLHCLIPGCEAVLPRSFYDINEHIKMHELTHTGIGGSQSVVDSKGAMSVPESVANLQQITTIEGFFNRKRGRPPKNRVVEVYSNAQLSPQAIFTSFKLEKATDMKAATHNNNNNASEEPLDPRFKRIRIIQPTEKCGDLCCTFSGMLHFHCSHSEACHFVTNFLSSMEDHLEDFHANVRIPEAFCYFDRGYNCKTPGCDRNRVVSHFHCTKCKKALVLPSETALHVCGVTVKCEPENLSTSSPAEEPEETRRNSVVRAAGTFFPENSKAAPESPPFCGQPTCKLQKKQHFHCDLCSHIFSDSESLAEHKPKCLLSQQLTAQQSKDRASPEPASMLGFSPNASFNQFQNFPFAHLALQYPYYYPNPLVAGFPGLPMPLLKPPNPSLPSSSFSVPPESPLSFGSKRKSKNEEALELTSRAKIPKSEPSPFGFIKGNSKIFKDEPIPSGYLKFRFNEDCNFVNCGYRNHQSHFHCCRQDCYYSFCDKTRFVQHTARHERLDKLMGDDFKQYRANMRCGHDNCVYNKNLGPNNKSSHFHCLKCDFICSDTNKVVAHRRQHSKLEYIEAAGFRKVASNETCKVEGGPQECPYSLKQTHYHCVHCEKLFVSRTQLSSHRH